VTFLDPNDDAAQSSSVFSDLMAVNQWSVFYEQELRSSERHLGTSELYLQKVSSFGHSHAWS
jgi:hypothetical protein